MKVGYIAPASISVVNGGVRTQSNMTIEQIKNFGVEPILISPWENLNIRELDLIHVFGATVENAGILPQIVNQGIPVVLSPVFYSNRSANLINKYIRIEKLLSFIGSGIRSDLGIKKELCDMADLILPNTKQESDLIKQGFGIPHSKINVIPNGVEDRFNEADKTLFVDKYRIEDFVLFVGQASAERKNVISLLKAAPKLNSKVVIVGSFDQSEYSQKCLALAKNTNNILLIDSLSHNSDLLSSAYAAAKVFVLPSYFETPGIAALEAGLAGANIAITEVGGTKEFFTNHAFYLDPKSESSIVDAINSALSKDVNSDLKVHILENYTWNKVAQKTLDQYKGLLK
ncbi:MAG: glycosyltransferase family 4 protein [Gracilimonas sp.]|nr:glycosyltransferase family 4 protein [Gracilimonas sp.]